MPKIYHEVVRVLMKMVMSINYCSDCVLDRAFILHDYLNILIIGYITNFITNIKSSAISKNCRRHGDFTREIGPILYI